MKKMTKRVLSLLLALMMVLGTCDTALAEGLGGAEDETPTVGSTAPYTEGGAEADAEDNENAQEEASTDASSAKPAENEQESGEKTEEVARRAAPAADADAKSGTESDTEPGTESGTEPGTEPETEGETETGAPFSATQSYGTLTVTVSAEAGVFPEGTELSLSDGGDFTAAVQALYGSDAAVVGVADVSLLSGGEAVQPAEGTTASVTVSYNGTPREGFAYKVFHIVGDAAQNVGVSGGAFSIGSFSPFGVAEVPVKYTVDFVADGDTVASVSVNSGTAIGAHMPDDPLKDN